MAFRISCLATGSIQRHGSLSVGKIVTVELTIRGIRTLRVCHSQRILGLCAFGGKICQGS